MEIIYSDEAQRDIQFWKNRGIKSFKKRFSNYFHR